MVVGAGLVRVEADVVVGVDDIHPALRTTVEQALARYEADRRPATTALMYTNRRQGTRRVMVLAHERAPHGFGDLGEVFVPGVLADIADSSRRAAGFHPDVLNSRPSPSRRVSADE